MNKAKILLLICIGFLVMGSNCQSNDAVFAFSWYAGHCMQIKGSGGCDSKKVAYWDHQSFTIHGLWPTHNHSNSYGPFNLSIITEDPALLDDMRNFWPPKSRKSGSETFLWEHEWQGDRKDPSKRRHGWDYSELLLRLHPQKYTKFTGQTLNNELQKAFFKDVIGFYKKYQNAFIRYPSKDLTKDSFARVFKQATGFNIKPEQFTFSCSEKNLVREVVLCFSLIPQGHVLKTCPDQTNKGCRRGNNFELPEWEYSTQDRVVDLYPIRTEL